MKKISTLLLLCFSFFKEKIAIKKKIPSDFEKKITAFEYTKEELKKFFLYYKINGHIATLIGNSFLYIEEYKLSERAYLRAIDLMPEYHEPYSSLLSLYILLERYDECEKIYLAGMKNADKKSSIMYQDGRLAFIKGNYEQSLLAARAIMIDEEMKHEKSLILALESLAELIKNGKKEEHEEEINRMIEIGTINFPFSIEVWQVMDTFKEDKINEMIFVERGEELDYDFYMSKYTVSQREFISVMGFNPSERCETSDYSSSDRYCIGKNRPVFNLTFYEAAMYCNKLSEKENLKPAYKIEEVTYGSYKNEGVVTSASIALLRDSEGYRLPKKSEWDYAAKGGKKSKGYNFYGSNEYDEVAWHHENCDSLQEVGLKKPNELGLYDMAGNIYEWCWDWHLNQKKVLGRESYICRPSRESLYLFSRENDVGFRVVRGKIQDINQTYGDLEIKYNYKNELSLADKENIDKDKGENLYNVESQRKLESILITITNKKDNKSFSFNLFEDSTDYNIGNMQYCSKYKLLFIINRYWSYKRSSEGIFVVDIEQNKVFSFDHNIGHFSEMRISHDAEYLYYDVHSAKGHLTRTIKVEIKDILESIKKEKAVENIYEYYNNEGIEAQNKDDNARMAYRMNYPDEYSDD